MSSIANDSIPEAPQWQAALEQKLQQAKSNQLTAPYGDVAKAFPSQDPHERTFDFNLINDTTFLPWAKSRGWKAIVSQETSTGESSFTAHSFHENSLTTLIKSRHTRKWKLPRSG